jgi:predicted small lipoprotein YifL
MRTTLVKLILLAVIASALSGCGANYSVKFEGPNARNAPPYK